MLLQYFDSLEGVAETEVTRYAGAVLLADYCPFIQVHFFSIERTYTFYDLSIKWILTRKEITNNNIFLRK